MQGEGERPVRNSYGPRITAAKRLFMAVVCGLLVAQAIGAVQVFLSDRTLYQRLLLIREQGYLAVPNQTVMPLLQGFKAPLLGGLFFTFSIGLGLCLLTLAGLWIWDRVLHRSWLWLLLLLQFWALGLILVNLNGFNPWATAYIALVPGVMTPLVWRRMVPMEPRQVLLTGVTVLLPVVVLAAAWLSLIDEYTFVRLRDSALLSNPVGVAINDFYYKYTMYPAEAIRPLAQKSVKTVSLVAVRDPAVRKTLQHLLLPYDYLPVDDSSGPVDLRITARNRTLGFEHKGKSVLEVTLDDFSASPDKVLTEFSAKVDTNLFFRHLTYLAIVFCLPVFLYALVAVPLRFCCGLVLRPGIASVAAAALSVCLGLGLLVFLTGGRYGRIDDAHLQDMVRSDRLRDRIEALRYIAEADREVGGLVDYRQMLASRSIPVRYWLARALGSSRRPETYKDLLALLDDPHPNVVCMAFYALGRRGVKQAIEEIRKRVETSGHWYEQWYGYRAMKTLGWRQQRRLKVVP